MLEHAGVCVEAPLHAGPEETLELVQLRQIAAAARVTDHWRGKPKRSPMSRSEIANLVMHQVKQELLCAGFERVDSGRVCLRIDADFLGWVGLNRGAVDGHLRINPFVGIHCIPLMRAYYKARGDRYVVGDTATFAVHLGEISPEATGFVVPNEDSVAPVARSIATSITIQGVPYMRQIANYDALARIFHRTPVEARTALPCECSFIEVLNLDRRAGNAESRLYRTG